MPINVSFNGATIYRPGAYSRTQIDLSGNVPLGPSGLIAIFGEADAGEPGSAETNIADNFYTADRITAARDKYKSGPIVDALNFLFAPAADGAIPNGASAVWVYKTNASARASLALAGSYGTIRSKEWGVGGNQISAKIVENAESLASKEGSDIAFAPVAEVSEVTMTLDGAGLDGVTGKYWTLNSANDATSYYVWYNVTDGTPPADPAPAGLTGIQVDVLLADTVDDVASKTAAAIDLVADFGASAVAAVVTVTNAATGPAADAADVDAGVSVNVTTQGDDATGESLNGASFSVRVNGGATSVITLSGAEGDHDSIADLVSELAGLLPVSMEVAASSSGNGIKLSMSELSTAGQLGYGRSFELVDSTPGDLAKLGLSAEMIAAESEPSVTITLNQKRDLLAEDDILGGNIVLEIGRDAAVGGVTSATVTVNLNQIILTDSSGSITFDKAAFVTIKQLAESISLQPGWSASVSSPVYNQLSVSTLDYVSNVGALSSAGSKPARLKKDSFEVKDFFAQSNIAGLVDPADKGLPAAIIETLLTGGSKGATKTTDIVAALSKFEKFHVNSIVPLFSRDATDDIADNLTDAASTYTIDGIHQAVKTHISIMKTTKKRSERQGYLSVKSSYAAAKEKVGNMADARLQMMIQDIRQSNAQGVIKWFQPWALACLMAGARGGAPIGLPLTFKFLNCSGIRHSSQPMNTAEADIVVDFDPDTQYDDAIQSGVTFLEAPRTGGFRVIVDNTTYGIDDNWVYNRANVLHAGDIVAYNFRNIMESRYIGVKNNVLAAEVRSTAESVLATYLSQGITVGTDDAPQGFKDLSVRIEGSTIFISVTVKLVEGIDFVLVDIVLQRASQNA